MSYAMNSRIGSLEKWKRETDDLLDQTLARIALLEEQLEKKNKPNGKNERARTARAS